VIHVKTSVLILLKKKIITFLMVNCLFIAMIQDDNFSFLSLLPTIIRILLSEDKFLHKYF